MRKFLIHLDFYPYYRLPEDNEIDNLNQEAKKQYELAKKQNVLYEALLTEIYFIMQDLNRENMRIYSSNDTGASTELPSKGTPKRLTPNQWNKTNGDIQYPDLLLDNIFLTERSIVNNKIKDFCTYPDRTFTLYEKTQKAIDRLYYKLKEYYQNYDHDLYYNAINFLHSLEYEVRKLI